MAFGNVGVQGVYASGKATAALDICLFDDEYLEASIITCSRDSRITASRSAAYNQQICF